MHQSLAAGFIICSVAAHCYAEVHVEVLSPAYQNITNTSRVTISGESSDVAGWNVTITVSESVDNEVFRIWTDTEDGVQENLGEVIFSSTVPGRTITVLICNQDQSETRGYPETLKP